MSQQRRPDAVIDLPLYTYFTIPQAMKPIIPSWLWKKKMVNSNTRSKKTGVDSSIKLFEGDVVDLYELIDDLTKKGFVPWHIHVQQRDNGTARVRVTWEKGKTPLSQGEVEWIIYVANRFLWDMKSYRMPEATEHLPPHINISCGKPVERDEATCVLSVQMVRDELALVNDPDVVQEATNRVHRKGKAKAGAAQ